MVKLYKGVRRTYGATVCVITDAGRMPLAPCNNVINHSPDGFEWGYLGSGPAQLALALCMDALDGDRARAIKVYQPFKEEHIAPIDGNEFSFTADQVRRYIFDIEKRAAA
jgi:hypothetical protein